MPHENFSWTRLNSLSTCGLQHDNRYNKKIKGVDKQTIYLVGRVVHSVIQHWAREGYPTSDVFLQTAIREALSAEQARLNKMDHDSAVEKIRLATVASQRSMKMYLDLQLPAHDAIIEQKFSVPLTEDIRLTGAPDAYDPVELSVVDLKTQRGGRAKKAQLFTYALAEKLLGRRVEKGVFLYPLQNSYVETITITESDIDKQKEIIIEANNNRFNRTPTIGGHCNFCEYYRTKHCTVTYTPRDDRRSAFTAQQTGTGES